MSDIVLRARAALDGVMPGPWYVEPETEVQAFVLTDTPTEVSGPRTCVAQKVTYPDAEFIAAAPQLIRDLCSEVERLRTIMERCANLAHMWETARPSVDGWNTDEAHIWSLAGIDLQQVLRTGA